MKQSFRRVWRDILFSHYEWWFVIGVPILLFGPMLLSGKVLYWGTPLLQFVPWREFAYDSLLHGHLPLWNPWLGMGAPLIANYQSAFFYPPNFVLLLSGVPWGHGLLVLLHVIWAGIGMLFFVRQLGLSRLSQAVAGLSFSMSGYVLARAGFISINATVSWLPWIMLAVERLTGEIFVERDSRKVTKHILFLSLMLAMQWLAGHAQISWYCLLLAIVWVIWRGFDRGRFVGSARSLLVFVASAVLAFMLAAIQLLPTMEYLLHSYRASEVERELALTYSFWPWRLLGLLMPNLFGNPGKGDFWGYANFWEDAIYIGVLPFLFAIFAVLKSMKKGKHSNLSRQLLALAIVSFLLALGKNTPIFTVLFEKIPTFDLFQAPTRWSIILEFCLVLLAAIGVELWQQGEIVRLFWVRLGTVAAIAASVVAMLSERFLGELKESFTAAIAIAGIWLAISGVLAWRRRLQPGQIWPFLVCSLIALDLLWAGSGLNPSLSKEIYEGQSRLVQQTGTAHRVYMSSEIEEEIKFNWTHRFDTYNPGVDWNIVRDSSLPNTALLDGVSSANNYDPILPSRYVKWMEKLEMLSEAQLEEILALMDVGWGALLDTDEAFKLQYEEVRGANRIRLVGTAIVVMEAETAFSEVFDGDFDPSMEVVLEAKSLEAKTTDPSGSLLELVDDGNPNRLRIEVKATADAWLVVSDEWYPGWRAEVDGKSVEIYPANYLFRAVRVPQGEHIVEFIYQPFSFTLGCILSLISWLLLGVLWWASKRR